MRLQEVAEIIVTISWVVIAIAVAALFYRVTMFVLVAFFGKNIHINHIDASGREVSTRINIDNDDELFLLLDKIHSNRRNTNS